MTSQGQGQVHVAVVGGSLTIWQRYLNNGEWIAYENLGGRSLFEPVLASRQPGELSVFYVGTDHDLCFRHFHDGWGPHTSLGGILSGPPAVTRRGTSHLDTFHIGRDGALYHKAWNGQTWTADYTRLDGNFKYVPTAVSWGSDHVSVLAVGLDNSLYHAQWSSESRWRPFEKVGVAGSGWHPLEKLGFAGSFGSWVGSPKAVSTGSGRIDVVGLGSQSTILHTSYSGSSWSPVRDLGGQWHSTPDIVSSGHGRIDVFAIGYDSATYNISRGETWGSWVSLGGLAIHPPKAVSDADGNVSVFVIGTDNGLYHKRMTGSEGFGPPEKPWEALGGACYSGPG
jgi:hypothetical protein